MRIGVIGAGVCGAAAVTRLRTALGDHAGLVVFEAAERIGGRVRSAVLGGTGVELGASLFHSANRLFSEYVDRAGLTVVPASSPAATVGVWNGSGFVFRTRGSRLLDNLALAVRFRTALVRASALTRQLVTKLDSVYPLLDNGTAWHTPADLLRDVRLADLPSCTARELFLRHRCSMSFVDSFADPVSRNNYGQVADELNGLAELVSLAGGGLAGGQLLRVREGNDAVCRALFTRARADVRFGVAVARVTPNRPGWTLHLADGRTEEVDAVLMAAPVELSGIQWEGWENRPRRQYKEVHATFVRGRPRAGCFGPRPQPDFVLTTAAGEQFFSLERVGPDLYKFFSPHRLGNEVLDKLFVAAREVQEVVWNAYPLLAPVREPGTVRFTIAHRAYNATALEHFVSTMETQAISGHAAANLLAAEL